MAIKYVDEADFSNQRVIARFDFNVPLNSDQEITDPTRIDRALPTIRLILEQKPKTLVLMSHLGRPKGKVNKALSLEPVAKYLAEVLKEEVVLSESCLDQGIRTLLELPNTKIIMLENLRFHSQETENDAEFARKLSSYGDLYVNDAFGAAHRKHASTYGINAYFKNKALGGLLLKKEIKALDKIVNSPKKPFCAIVGGAKVSDKIKVIETLLTTVDHLLIGGAMAYPFLKAKGHSIGKSLCSEEDILLAKKILREKSSHKILLPQDHIVADNFEASEGINTSGADIDENQMGLDIGKQTLAAFSAKVRSCRTILWNGPMGIFEKEQFSKGTFGLAHTLAELKDSFTLVGGGDSVSAVNKSGLSIKMGHVSTGGGASLEYIENGSLPGISALKFGLN